MTERQCSSCGGFCKRSGCERENVKRAAELRQLHSVNAQLLEALESMVASCWSDGFTNRKYNSDEHEENVQRDLVLAAIAAAKEKV